MFFSSRFLFRFEAPDTPFSSRVLEVVGSREDPVFTEGEPTADETEVESEVSLD